MFPTFNTFHKLLVAGLALSLFTAVLVIGGLGGLHASKRQFEAEAQNIVAVLRSGMSVVDGVATSLEASHSSVAAQGYQQLDLQLAKVLSNYDFVTGLGRFEKVAMADRAAFEGMFGGTEASTTSSMWRFTDTGPAPIQSAAESWTHYPLAVVKSRVGSANEFTDLTGFDLSSFPDARRTIENATSVGRSIVAALPASWQRPGHLLVFRTTATDKVLNGGYLLELDVEEMASAGGVNLNDFSLSLSSFSEQGEFESRSSATSLFRQTAQADDQALFSTLFKDDRWLSSFDVGDKTLVLEISRATGLSARLAIAALTVAALLSLMFLSIVQVNSKRRLAQKLQKIESEKLFQAQQLAAVTLASIGDGVITTDANDTIVYANRAAEALLGYAQDDMQGRTVNEAIVLRAGKSENAVSDGSRLTLVAADNSIIHVNKKESDLQNSDGEYSGHVIVLRDVSVEQSLTLALQHKVNHDALTGLSNRLNFEQQIDNLFESTEEAVNGYGVFFIDLDRFKEVNDTCGHAAGDELLILIGNAFKDNVRDNDLVARLGGDEFGVIVRDCSKSDAMVVAERIRGFFQSFYFEYDEHVFPVRCSIGMVHFDPLNTNRDDVLKIADAACYDAKNSGRNSICERTLDESVDEQQGASGVLWLPRIKDALDNEKFTLHLQSIKSLNDGSANSHEILLRMIDDDGSLICPAPFMKTAVRYNLALDIDRWVVNQSLAKIADLPSNLSTHRFAINLSTQTIGSTEFLEFLARQIALSGVDPSRLCFDLKESDVLSNPVGTAEFCRELQVMGCEVVLDDFGAAMTSFSTLKMLPINSLKIDGSLIASLNREDAVGSADYALVKSIHSFAASMGLTTIAEQVEDVACLEVLKSIQLDYAQGMAVSEPLPFEDFILGSKGAQQQRAA